MNICSGCLYICCPGPSERAQALISQQNLHKRQEVLEDQLSMLERRTVSVERELAAMRARYESTQKWDTDKQRQDNYFPTLVKLWESSE
mmetsp:Transcript_6637/g.11720  ORF Transcript_6637/g.11720 Transcript_6637/m.11720 type:complete len:89 (+) Transcript_6637:3419-3685(+)